jgi:hypothetical protein
VVSVTDPYGRILGFLDRSRYFITTSQQYKYVTAWTVSISLSSVPVLYNFQVFAPITAKFGVLIWGVLVDVSESCKRGWSPVKANLFPHYFLRNNVIGIATTMW